VGFRASSEVFRTGWFVESRLPRRRQTLDGPRQHRADANIDEAAAEQEESHQVLNQVSCRTSGNGIVLNRCLETAEGDQRASQQGVVDGHAEHENPDRTIDDTSCRECERPHP